MPLNSGNTLRKDASEMWNALSGNQKSAANLALLYGAQGSMGNLPGTESERVLATQMLIWEIVTGCRNAAAPYGRTDSKFYEGLCAGGTNSGVAAGYNQIVENMKNHATIPSFASSKKDSAAKG
ncbi:MAG: thioester domain-containing protein [Muricomes sp.]